ncbi:uncharacterized protein LOC135817172 [Sycon ciliatum]|uniref:uncharacterized protein LOC135817172 n=1 Tax=Sycon ciliatum TaxID=27933 RepID=UPI0031F5FC44
MSGAQAAATTAVVLEMDTLGLAADRHSHRCSHGGSQASLNSHHSGNSGTSGPGRNANGAVMAADAPKLVVSEGQLDIRAFYESVKAPGTKDNVAFAAEVDKRLKWQEETALPPEEILDRGEAEGSIFGGWLAKNFGSADTALLRLTSQKWLADNLTSTIVKGLLKAHDASARATDHVSGQTCLHQCAVLAYTCTLEVIFDNDPLVWMVKDGDGLNALELALDAQLPDTSILIMEKMPNSNVREVFEGKKRPFYALMNNLEMKDVTHAVMDRMIDAWPEEEQGRGFDFHYTALESDTNGLTPDTYGFSGNNSCFLNILKRAKLANEFSQDRAVRMLLFTKWSSYGEKMLWVSTLNFLVFIVLFTLADVFAVDKLNPQEYNQPVDYARAVCEAIVLLVVAFFLLGEIVELFEKRLKYLGEFYNYIQLSSIFLILAIVPLRALDLRSQWILLALGYLLTTIRIFKFISASSLIGVYTRVLVGICQKVLPKFFLIFSLALFVWSGAFYASLRSHVRGSEEVTDIVADSDGLAQNVTRTIVQEDKGLILELSSYGETLFLGFRVLVEGRNLIQYYSNSQQLGALPVILYLLFLIGVVMIMRTILIAQMAATFGAMNRDAVRQVEINRAWVLPDLEASKLWDIALKGWRMRFYKPSAGFTEKRMQEILQEEKVDGFLKLEKILNKQKQLLESQQQQTIAQLTHQTILQEKWTGQLMQAVVKTEKELGDAVHSNHELTENWGSKTSAGIMSVRNHLSGQLEEAQTEQEKAAQSIQERILQQTLQITSNLDKVEVRLGTQEQRQESTEKTLEVIDSKLVAQKEQGSRHTEQIETLSKSEADSSVRKDKKLQALEERLDQQEGENRALTKRLNQQGFQLEQVVEMLQRLEVSSNKLISEVSMLRRTAGHGGVDFSATFDDKLAHFQKQSLSKGSSLPHGLAGLSSSAMSPPPSDATAPPPPLQEPE